MDIEAENLHNSISNELDLLTPKLNDLRHRFKLYLKDKRIPLELRWDRFIWYGGSILNLSKNTISFCKLQEEANEYIAYFLDYGETEVFFPSLVNFFETSLERKEQEIIELKEQLLATGYKGYCI